MADNDKKGPRDISDLKARLGLKKQGGAAPGPVPAPVPHASGGFPAALPRPAQAPLHAALSGIPAPSAVPPPPGFPRPQEAAPPPDPRRDPFAAQQAAVAANLAAFYGGGGALPGDANAVQGEQLEKKANLPLILGGIGAAVVMFGVGYAGHSILAGRADYNDTTDQAAKVRDEVVKMQKSVSEAQVLLQEANKERGAVNFGSIKKIKDLDKADPDLSRSLFHTNYYSFDPPTIQQLFNYYNDVLVLTRLMQEHTQRTLNDQDGLEKFFKAGAGKSEKRLGVVLDYSQKTPFSQVVELTSAPFCPDPKQTDCQPAEMKIRFRATTGGGSSERPLKGRPQEAVFPMTPTELQQQLLTGDPNMLAYEGYIRRTKAISETLIRIKEEEKVLVGSLEKRAKEAKLFTL